MSHERASRTPSLGDPRRPRERYNRPALQARGVTQATLDRLVERGLIEASKRSFANPPGLVVWHYYAKD